MIKYTTRLYKMLPWLIRALIPEGCKGTYVLYRYELGEIVPIYIGRSDTDLQRRLLNHPYLYTAEYFEYYSFQTVEKAFLSESALYHCFQDSLLNQIHPATPAHSDLICPICRHNFNMIRNDRVNIMS